MARLIRFAFGASAAAIPIATTASDAVSHTRDAFAQFMEYLAANDT
jgi:hypothetical protein